jgi:hypothetical protein
MKVPVSSQFSGESSSHSPTGSQSQTKASSKYKVVTAASPQNSQGKQIKASHTNLLEHIKTRDELVLEGKALQASAKQHSQNIDKIRAQKAEISKQKSDVADQKAAIKARLDAVREQRLKQ